MTNAIETVLWFALGGEREDHEMPDPLTLHFACAWWLRATVQRRIER
jgi:hypothetical protein